MPRRFSRSYLISHVLRVLPSTRVTVSYPRGPLELPETFRGQIVVDVDRCSGCGTCMRDCPTGAITIEKLPNNGVRIRHDDDVCVACGQCELGCPRKAVRLGPSYCQPSATRQDFGHEWVREGPRHDE